MSELLFMLCTVLAGLLACLARPGAPEHWSLVKAARPVALPAAAEVALEQDFEPGFADGLSSSVIALAQRL